ncbi:DUF1926 domain-containing protein [Myxococcota bacterium]|nr:DUF1926 domain-containing protein [Myxococcota bacterium]
MEGLDLALVLTAHQPLGTPEPALQEAARWVYEPVLNALTEHPALRIGLAMSGTLMDWLDQRQPRLLELLAELVRRGQVELLTGGWSFPFLDGLAERDALAQLRAHSEGLRQRLGARPKGGLATEDAWDPALVPIFARSGLSWALADERLLDPGGPSQGVRALFITERDGHTLRLLPSSGQLRPLFTQPSPVPLLKLLARKAKQGTEALAVVESVERMAESMGPERLGAWVRAVARVVDEQTHWLRAVTPGALVARLEPGRRVSPPAWTPPHLTRWSLSPAETERLARYQAACADHPALRAGPPFARGRSWRESLSRYDEANQLHKRLRFTSEEVHRLRRAAEDDAAAGRTPVKLQPLVTAERRLFVAQSGEVLWHSPGGGVYESRARHAAWAALADAERAVARALGDRRGARAIVGDHDGDGYDEVFVRAEALTAMVEPEAGGALGELTFFDIPGNVLNTMTRREETLHRSLDRFTTLPALVGKDDVVAPSPRPELPQSNEEAENEPAIISTPELTELDAPLAAALAFDRRPRRSMQDHFFPATTTPEQLSAGQHEELGDFFGARYKLDSAEADDEGRSVVQLSREGEVREGQHQRLVRVVKRLVFPPEEPWVEARYDVVNRYAEPVHALFAVELNLNLDGVLPEGGGIMLPGGQRRDARQPGRAEKVAKLSISGLLRRFALHLTLSTPATLFHYPVETVCRDGQRARRASQGVCLLLAWDLALWGQERARFDLKLQLVKLKSGS